MPMSGRCSVRSSVCQARPEPTSRTTAVRSGKIPTTSVRRRISRVVEVSADLALDGLRWRHPVRFVRARDDLQAGDLASRVL
jgi:hypothetical protein